MTDALSYGGSVAKPKLCCFFCCCLFWPLQVCVGAEAEDKFHMVEIEGLTYDGKSTKVPLAVLKPSIMPSVSASRRIQISEAFIVQSYLCAQYSGENENQAIVWHYLIMCSFFLPCHLFTTLSCKDEFRWIRDHASCYLPSPGWLWSSSH